MTPASAGARLPNLLCIGAPKCGTSWLASVLQRHPDVFLPPQKELNVLHYDDCATRQAEYADYFRDAGTAKLRADFSVRYLASPNAPGNAERFLGEFRAICVLRDPVAQVCSHYWHLRRQNFHQTAVISPAPSLLEALQRFPALLVEPVLYHKHLVRWQAVVPAERLFVFDHACLQTDEGQARLLNVLQAFLDIEVLDLLAMGPAPDESDARVGVQPRDGILGRIYPYLYTGVTRGPYQWLKRNLGVAAGESLKRRLGLERLSRAVFFRAGYPTPTAAEVTAIRALVADDQAALDRSVLRAV